MKIKKLASLFMCIALVVLIGCSHTEDRRIVRKNQLNSWESEYIAIDNMHDNLFDLKLFIDNRKYKTTEKISIWATIEYIGEDNEITVWSGDPYIHFYITDEKEFNTGGLTFTILKPTYFKKGLIYSFDFHKNGGYSNDDPNADFWKKFYSEKDLFLPVGKYQIKVSTAFSLSPNGGDYSQYEEIEIEVE